MWCWSVGSFECGSTAQHIPNSPKPDHVVNPVPDYDYGPEFRYDDESGVITNVPPAIRRVIPTLVPKVDADGNEMGGVPSLLRAEPDSFRGR